MMPTTAGRTFCLLALTFSISCGGASATAEKTVPDPPAGMHRDAAAGNAAPDATAQEHSTKQELSTKRDQCNRLIIAANAQQRVITAATDALGTSNDLAVVIKLGNILDLGAHEVADVPLDDPQLLDLQRRYARMLDGAAQNVRSYVEAVKAKDVPKLRAAKEALSSVGSEERKVVGDLNAYCEN